MRGDDQFKKALARLVRERNGLSYTPKITSTHFDSGGDVQIGDYTWDHDNASFIVRYRDPSKSPGGTYTDTIDLEYYEGGFGGFINDLLIAGLVEEDA